MKTYLTFLLAGITSLCFAQNRNELTKTFDDDGVTLAISVKGVLNGRPVDFSKTFRVADMDDDEKEDLKMHILDSLGVNQVREAHAQIRFDRAESNMVVTLDNTMNMREKEPEPTVAPEAEAYARPFKKEIRMDSEKGELYMHYNFVKEGEEFSFEKTVNITDKSDAERLQIISDYERSINLPARTIQ